MKNNIDLDDLIDNVLNESISEDFNNAIMDEDSKVKDSFGMEELYKSLYEKAIKEMVGSSGGATGVGVGIPTSNSTNIPSVPASPNSTPKLKKPTNNLDRIKQESCAECFKIKDASKQKECVDTIEAVLESISKDRSKENVLREMTKIKAMIIKEGILSRAVVRTALLPAHLILNHPKKTIATGGALYVADKATGGPGKRLAKQLDKNDVEYQKRIDALEKLKKARENEFEIVDNAHGGKTMIPINKGIDAAEDMVKKQRADNYIKGAHRYQDLENGLIRKGYKHIAKSIKDYKGIKENAVKDPHKEIKDRIAARKQEAKDESHKYLIARKYGQPVDPNTYLQNQYHRELENHEDHKLMDASKDKK